MKLEMNSAPWALVASLLLASGPLALADAGGIPTQVVFTQQPSVNTPTGIPFQQEPVVTLEDGAGNPVTTLDDECTITLGLNSPNGNADAFFGTLEVNP